MTKKSSAIVILTLIIHCTRLYSKICFYIYTVLHYVLILFLDHVLKLELFIGPDSL